MILCKVENGKMYGENCIHVKVSAEGGSAIILDIKKGMKINNFVKSYSWEITDEIEP